MASQDKLDSLYMGFAELSSIMSCAQRKKVGALLVVPNGGRYEGWNGTPSGFDNNCEDVVNVHHVLEPKDNFWGCQNCDKTWPYQDEWISTVGDPCDPKLVTKPEVLHAETNAIAKVTASTDSSAGGTMYCTLSPCIECAKLMIQAKIKRFVYMEMYKTDDGQERHEGVRLLEKAKIVVDKY